MNQITINGTTYVDDGDNYEIKDGVVYSLDPNHCGIFALSDEGLTKYFNGDKDMVEDMTEGDYHVPYDEDGENGDYDAKFPYHFVFYHASNCIDSETGEETEDTPHGTTYEEEFVAYFNDFPVEVFNDNENVVHYSFCDG